MQELLLRVQHILQRAYRAELSRTKPAPLQLGQRQCFALRQGDRGTAVFTLQRQLNRITKDYRCV